MVAVRHFNLEDLDLDEYDLVFYRAELDEWDSLSLDKFEQEEETRRLQDAGNQALDLLEMERLHEHHPC